MLYFDVVGDNDGYVVKEESSDNKVDSINGDVTVIESFMHIPTSRFCLGFPCNIAPIESHMLTTRPIKLPPKAP